MKFLRAHRGGIRMTHASRDTNTEDIPLAIKQLIRKPLWLTTGTICQLLSFITSDIWLRVRFLTL